MRRVWTTQKQSVNSSSDLFLQDWALVRPWTLYSGCGSGVGVREWSPTTELKQLLQGGYWFVTRLRQQTVTDCISLEFDSGERDFLWSVSGFIRFSQKWKEKVRPWLFNENTSILSSWCWLWLWSRPQSTLQELGFECDGCKAIGLTELLTFPWTSLRFYFHICNWNFSKTWLNRAKYTHVWKSLDLLKFPKIQLWML